MKNIGIGAGKSFLAVMAVALLIAVQACSSTPSTPTTSSTRPAVTISLTAQNMTFDKSTITVSAGSAVTVNFSNKDAGIQHNFSLYTDSSATKMLFAGNLLTGVGTTTYTFTAPATAGTYFFRCDVHPTVMTGSFIVQ